MNSCPGTGAKPARKPLWRRDMAVSRYVFTIGYVARMLGEDENRIIALVLVVLNHLNGGLLNGLRIVDARVSACAEEPQMVLRDWSAEGAFVCLLVDARTCDVARLLERRLNLYSPAVTEAISASGAADHDQSIAGEFPNNIVRLRPGSPFPDNVSRRSAAGDQDRQQNHARYPSNVPSAKATQHTWSMIYDYALRRCFGSIFSCIFPSF